MGVLLLLIIPFLSVSPDYQFNLVWEISPPFIINDFADLDGDGLCEILCSTVNFETEYYMLTLLDSFSNIIWEIPIDGLPSSSRFEDLDGDGIKEILLTEQVFSTVDSQNSPDSKVCRHYRWKVACITAEGTVVWTWDTDENHGIVRIKDTTGDGQKEIIIGNTILNNDGIVLSENDNTTTGSELVVSDYPMVHDIDLDGDGNQESVIVEMGSNKMGTSNISVYDSQTILLWQYTDPHFFTGVSDIDNNGTYEFLVYYTFDSSQSGWSFAPRYLRILNYDGSEKWTIFFDNALDIFWVSDLDRDEDTEIIVYVVQSTEGRREDFFYILGPSGALEAQLKIYESVPFFQDIDGDGDTDILLSALGDRRISLYTNSCVKGPLDELSGERRLQQVNLRDEGLKRAPWVSPSIYYGVKELIYCFRHPTSISLAPRGVILLIMVIVVGLGFMKVLRKEIQEKKREVKE